MYLSHQERKKSTEIPVEAFFLLDEPASIPQVRGDLSSASIGVTVQWSEDNCRESGPQKNSPFSVTRTSTTKPFLPIQTLDFGLAFFLVQMV